MQDIQRSMHTRIQVMEETQEQLVRYVGKLENQINS